MNSIKTVFLAALLSAAAYGVYVGVTGAPPSFGPHRKAHNWDDAGPPDPFNSTGFTETPAAPIVSADAAPPPAVAPTPAATPEAVTPLSDGSPVTAVQAPPSAPVNGASPADSRVQPEATAPAGQDRYSSNQPYPSARPDPQSLPIGPSDSAPRGDRYAPRRGYPSTDAPTEQLADAQEPTGNADDINADYAALMQSVQTLLAANRLADAHLELSEWYGNPRMSPDQEAQITDLLDRLAGTVIYSREHLLERPYEVQPGDSLEKIAEMYEVPPQLLANINGLRDHRDLLPGGKLKVVKGPFSACVCLSKFHLVLYLGSRYAGRFPIGIGSDAPVADGDFIVQRKLTNPVYYGRPVVDKDDPNNPLGEYALDLGNSILIHGTNSPASIGRTEDRGCIKLDDRNIQDVFNILVARSDRTTGSKVKILRQPTY